MPWPGCARVRSLVCAGLHVPVVCVCPREAIDNDYCSRRHVFSQVITRLRLELYFSITPISRNEAVGPSLFPASHTTRRA